VPGKPVFPERGTPAATLPPAPSSTIAPDRTRVRNRFNQFLETTVQPLLPLDNIITVDLQKGRQNKINILKGNASATTICFVFKSL
jgi:hypothetical protein